MSNSPSENSEHEDEESAENQNKISENNDEKLGSQSQFVVEEFEEPIDEKPRSIIMGIVKQLKFGMDLSRVTCLFFFIIMFFFFFFFL
jgi:hypothetical protein